jgi:hypothetical protein
MIKKLSRQLLVAAFLTAALSLIPASARADDKSAHETKSDNFIKPASGLDIKPVGNMKKMASILSSHHLPLSDVVDIGLVFEKPKKQDYTDKKRSADKRALLDITFHF